MFRMFALTGVSEENSGVFYFFHFVGFGRRARLSCSVQGVRGTSEH